MKTYEQAVAELGRIKLNDVLNGGYGYKADPVIAWVYGVDVKKLNRDVDAAYKAAHANNA